jgi:hypothetical protein
LIKLNKNTLEELSKFSGVKQEEIEKNLKILVDQGKLKKEEDKYFLP